MPTLEALAAVAQQIDPTSVEELISDPPTFWDYDATAEYGPNTELRMLLIALDEAEIDTLRAAILSVAHDLLPDSDTPVPEYIEARFPSSQDWADVSDVARYLSQDNSFPMPPEIAKEYAFTLIVLEALRSSNLNMTAYELHVPVSVLLRIGHDAITKETVRAGSGDWLLGRGEHAPLPFSPPATFEPRFPLVAGRKMLLLPVVPRST